MTHPYFNQLSRLSFLPLNIGPTGPHQFTISPQYLPEVRNVGPTFKDSITFVQEAPDVFPYAHNAQAMGFNPFAQKAASGFYAHDAQAMGFNPFAQKAAAHAELVSSHFETEKAEIDALLALVKQYLDQDSLDSQATVSDVGSPSPPKEVVTHINQSPLEPVTPLEKTPSKNRAGYEFTPFSKKGGLVDTFMKSQDPEKPGNKKRQLEDLELPHSKAHLPDTASYEDQTACLPPLNLTCPQQLKEYTPIDISPVSQREEIPPLLQKLIQEATDNLVQAITAKKNQRFLFFDNFITNRTNSIDSFRVIQRIEDPSFYSRLQEIFMKTIVSSKVANSIIQPLRGITLEKFLQENGLDDSGGIHLFKLNRTTFLEWSKKIQTNIDWLNINKTQFP